MSGPDFHTIGRDIPFISHPIDDVEARALYDESIEAERKIGQRLADEVLVREGVWTPLQTALALQLREQARLTATLRKQLVLVVSG